VGREAALPLVDEAKKNAQKNGWSVLPSCSWLVLDKEGNPTCKFVALREHLVPLGIAKYTLFDQHYVSEAIANWRENYPDDYKYSCSPKTCPSRLTRLLNEIHR
jgi:hypothetical protein